MFPVHIGTSGWNYDHWKGNFYPQGQPKSRWLEYYCTIFKTVELNATFYRQMKPKTFENWYKRTPDGFLWSIKMNRFITHIRRLKDAKQPVDRFMDSARLLREKLGPILVQLPPSLAFDSDVFENFCSCLHKDLRYTIEARHESWTSDKALAVLEEHNMAWCISDTAGRYPYLEAVTADFVYIRLHGSRKLYASEYTEEELESWAAKIQGWNRTTFVYFDNDFMGFAPRNAKRLRELLG
ncbi:MAG: DUF72 domain-containing protein [Deltaproteobacteria bacterium]|nr:DUF72 domain-containing protein [Deltaproteobacteria bacterium]